MTSIPGQDAAVRILVVVDDRKLALALRHGFENAGLRLDNLESAEEALAAARGAAYDVIVLDEMLTGRLDAFALCEGLRARGVASPVLMLAPRMAVDDRRPGQADRPDDILIKPFAFRDLLARIRALTRSGVVPARTAVLEVGDLRLDPDAWSLTGRDHTVALTTKELALVELLMQHAGRLLSHDQIEEQLWTGGVPNTGSTLVEVYVSRVRRKLAACGTANRITTVWGAGYLLESGSACASISDTSPSDLDRPKRSGT